MKINTTMRSLLIVLAVILFVMVAVDIGWRYALQYAFAHL